MLSAIVEFFHNLRYAKPFLRPFQLCPVPRCQVRESVLERAVLLSFFAACPGFQVVCSKWKYGQTTWEVKDWWSNMGIRCLEYMVPLRSHGDLVGGLEHCLYSHILGMSSSQLTFIYFRMVGQPPTRNHWIITWKSSWSPLRSCWNTVKRCFNAWRCGKDCRWECAEAVSHEISRAINGGVHELGYPKWLVYFMENPIKMDDLGVPLFQETPK